MTWYKEAPIESMLGRVMSAVQNQDNQELVFTTSEGDKFTFYHCQDCCESVSITDICGDLQDLVGSPLTLAEEINSDNEPAPNEDGYTPESYTWTFYKFATAKGYVTVRWLGTSNGYYGEGVSLRHEQAA